MSLDPRFVVELMSLMSMPAAQVDIAIGIFFPHIRSEYVEWTKTKMVIQAGGMPGTGLDYASTYDWLQLRFTKAPLRDDKVAPEELYRELLKHIIAKAFNIEYTTVKILH